MIKHYFLLIACIASLFFSCEKKNQVVNNEHINQWIYNEMSFYYLWNENIPRSPNYGLFPSMFFQSLLYKSGQITGDRFSWIQENYADLLNSIQGVTPYDIGFEYRIYQISPVRFVGQVLYVKPGTDAERLGLKRGDYFLQVNGEELTPANWRSVFSKNKTSAVISLLDWDNWQTTDIKVQKMANYAENPVFFDNVYDVEGHKIGYLVYNFFASGPTSGDFSYDRELNDAFGRFKQAGITELVLDLRYNNGGSMNSATLLSSMIVPGLDTNKVLTKLEYNAIIQTMLVEEEGEDALVDKFRDRLATQEPVNNVGGSIQKLYVLTSRSTASASEMVINGLEPYLSGNIFLIGDTTVGKNVGSVSIYEENNRQNKWGMQPIVLRYFNKDGKSDFLEGFIPDIVEKDNGDKLPLGDPNEIMLRIAINHITGNYVPQNLRSGASNRSSVGSSIQQKAMANQAFVDGSLRKKLKH